MSRGHGTYVDEDNLTASVAGEVERVDKLICVKPLKTRYVILITHEHLYLQMLCIYIFFVCYWPADSMVRSEMWSLEESLK